MAHFDTAKCGEPRAAHMSEDTTESEDERVTAPMQTFGPGEVTIGFVVLAVGLLLTFGLALVV